MSANKRRVWIVFIALAVAWLLVLRGILAPRSQVWSWPFVPQVDGAWQAVSLDGQKVPRSVRYSVTVESGRLRGGFDGCNSWAFVNDKPDANGYSPTTSTMVRCSRLPLQALYRRSVFATPRLKLVKPDTLFITAPPHSGLFRRSRTGQ